MPEGKFFSADVSLRDMQIGKLLFLSQYFAGIFNSYTNIQVF